MNTTATDLLIRNAAWAVLWDGERHVYRRNQDLGIADGRIAWIRPAGDAPAAGAEVVDGSGLMVLPGLVNLHAHPSTEPGLRGIREDHGWPGHYGTGLYERAQAFKATEAGRRAGLEIAYAELLRSGVTTLADLTLPLPGWTDVMRRSGMRVYVAPRYHSGRWVMKGSAEVGVAWDEQAGRKAFRTALEIIEEVERDPSGRLKGIVYPAQVDTTAEDLLRDSIDLARDSGRPLHIHAGQSLVEFQEMVRRTGRTPIQYLNDVGFLGPKVTIGHAMFVDEHTATHWHGHRDVALLADTGTSVAHCPSPFARYGNCLESFSSYRARGVNLGIGTDVAPHNLIEEMRLAALLGRVQSHGIEGNDTAAVFHAATVGGATALGRDDLGRLAVGCKADLLLVDLSHPTLQPGRDPLRALIWSGAERPITRVYVDGKVVMADGRAIGLDPAKAAEILAEEQARMLRDAPLHDHSRRSGETIAPLSLPLMD